MLLGYFLHNILENKPEPAAADTLQPGAAVVAVGNMQQLRETGLPCSLRFGIVSKEQQIICQCCVSEADTVPESLEFIIRKMDIQEFTGGNAELYTCHIPGSLDACEVQLKAAMRVGTQTYQFRSYPGDDFVAECLTGLSALELARQSPRAGQHWWTPLRMTLRQGMRWLGVGKYASLLPDSADVQVFDQTHHGIAIEGDQVIHFSTRRVPDESNKIKTDSLKEFRSIGDDTNSGSPVKYKEETAEIRLTSRNRAVWIFCHAHAWGGYNLADNNCEHFSRYCRAGWKESRQVVAAAMELVGLILASLPEYLPFPLTRLLGSLIRGGAHKLGRPEPMQEDSLLPNS